MTYTCKAFAAHFLSFAKPVVQDGRPLFELRGNKIRQNERRWAIFSFSSSSFFTHQPGEEERADATEQEPSNSTTSVRLSATSNSLQPGPGESNGTQQATQGKRASVFLSPFHTALTRPPIPSVCSSHFLFSSVRSSRLRHQSSCFSPVFVAPLARPVQEKSRFCRAVGASVSCPLWGAEFQLHFLRR
jgi:hypothetical protein